jgi:hypothetical protein
MPTAPTRQAWTRRPVERSEAELPPAGRCMRQTALLPATREPRCCARRVRRCLPARQALEEVGNGPLVGPDLQVVRPAAEHRCQVLSRLRRRGTEVLPEMRRSADFAGPVLPRVRRGLRKRVRRCRGRSSDGSHVRAGGSIIGVAGPCSCSAGSGTPQIALRSAANRRTQPSPADPAHRPGAGGRCHSRGGSSGSGDGQAARDGN